MANAYQSQLPNSLEEVEALILQLYAPGAADKVATTQETLQKLQRSPQGWQLASSLLGNEIEEVRFFGALTFIVKLNTDAKSLGDEDAQTLLQTLIGFLIQSLANGEGVLVLRKLCSTLVAYFLQFSTGWERCIKHLMFCLYANEVVPLTMMDEAPGTHILVQGISDEKAVALLWFASSLVEEVGKTDSSSMKQHRFHKRMVSNVEDIVPLISRYVVESPDCTGVKLRHEAMKCFQSWVSYSHRAFIDDGISLDSLKTLTKPAIMCLVNEDLYETTIELFSDVLSNYSKFLDKEDFSLLQSLFNSPWAHERYSRLIQGDFDFDLRQFGMFMIAFGDATIQDLTRNIEIDPMAQQFLSALGGLLSADGYIVYEDKIFVPALEFWMAFVETMIDDVYSSEGGNPPWFERAQTYVLQVIERCLQKIQFPPAQEFNSWDSVDRTGFKDARRDFSDLIQQFYIVTGIPIFQLFIDLANKAGSTNNWAELEVALFCISWLSDCDDQDEKRDEYLHKVFTPSVLAIFADQANDIPIRTKKSFLEMVYGYANYFQNSPAQLPTVLNILFTATGSPALAKTASRSIFKICSDCRKVLLPELGPFLQYFGNVSSNSSLDGSVKEGIIRGISAIIQALPEEDMKLAPLEQLLDFVEAEVEQCLQLFDLKPQGEQAAFDECGSTTNKGTTASDLGVMALKCLGGIADGIQYPDDQPLDLERRDKFSPFWTTGPGARVQHRISGIINRVYDALQNHGEIVEAACGIWRQGLREMEPGPFVMPPSIIAQFFTKADEHTPRLGIVISTATSLIYSYKWGLEIEAVLTSLLNWVAQLLHAFAEPRTDPEIAQVGIEFLNRLLPKYLHILLAHQPPASLEFLFMFTLKALAGTDPLPKGAAADFWATFVGLPSQEPVLQASIDNALQHLGPILTQALVFNIGGHAARSELDKLSDPIRKLVVRQAQVKNWFEAALFGSGFPSEKVTEKDKRVFLQKIINLRGAKGTNQIVRDFWLACRGSNFAYAS